MKLSVTLNTEGNEYETEIDWNIQMELDVHDILFVASKQVGIDDSQITSFVIVGVF